jgi:hypothetical protein
VTLLAELLERARSARLRPPVFIYDLDSTLFSTAPRNLAILRAFVAEVGAPPELDALIARLAPADLGWNPVDDLRARGFRHDGTLDRLRKFWRRRFFAEAYLRHDVPIVGAVAYVRASHDAGAHVVYLTGRDEPGMGRGTVRALHEHGFPLGADRATLRMKPSAAERDLPWKTRAIADLEGVVAAFENEPANANLFAERFPDAGVVLLDTVCSPDAPPLRAGIARVRDYASYA